MKMCGSCARLVEDAKEARKKGLPPRRSFFKSFLFSRRPRANARVRASMLIIGRTKVFVKIPPRVAIINPAWHGIDISSDSASDIMQSVQYAI